MTLSEWLSRTYSLEYVMSASKKRALSFGVSEVINTELTLKQQEAFRRIVFADMSQKDVAAHMGVTQATVFRHYNGAVNIISKHVRLFKVVLKEVG